jgi:hypothetical protein
VAVRLAVKKAELKGEKNNVTFTLTARDNPTIKVSHTTTFIGPSHP